MGFRSLVSWLVSYHTLEDDSKQPDLTLKVDLNSEHGPEDLSGPFQPELLCTSGTWTSVEPFMTAE